MIAGLDFEGKDISARYSRHEIAYETDTPGERLTRTEANVDMPLDCSVSGYLSRHSISKENFKPRMGGSIHNLHVPLTS